MSKIDQKYIDALDNFTVALEEIVETLKEQQKNDKADVVNEMLNNTPINNINNVVKDLKKTTEKGFADIKSDNKTIIREIKNIKSQKEAGMFERIEDPKNKNKIVDGIKVVMLIAGGVLALGMAFKIIGKVDFMSVVALSTAMLFIANSFSKMMDIKNLSLKNVLLTASTIPIMAAALAASGYILSFFPKITPMDGISILLVSGALGVASYLLLKAVSKLDAKSLIMVPLLPVMLPMVALGIVASSYILKNVQPLTFMQVLSVGLVGLALGVATVGISFALKAMKGVTWKELIMLPLSIPLIAGGIVLASMIFQGFVPLKDPVKLLIGSAVIGISMLFFVPAIMFLGKLKIADLATGLLAILPLAWAMTLASSIFNNFINIKDPIGLGVSSLAMGISLLIFAPVVWVMGKMGIKNLTLGTLGSLIVAGGILGVSYIFSLLPDSMKYPEIQWTLGAGLSILGFGLFATGIGLLITASGGIGAIALAAGLVSILAIAGTIVGVAAILNKGDYSSYPPLDWAMGVGLSLVTFSLAAIFAAGAGIVSAVSSLFTGDRDPLLTLANSMVDISIILQKGQWGGNYPGLDWAKGVGKSLFAFAGLTILAGGVSLVKGITEFFTGDDDPLMTVAQSMVGVSRLIQQGVYTGNYPNKEWALGVGKSLSLFAAVTILSDAKKLSGAIVNFFTKDESDPLMTLTQSIVDVSKKIQEGVYTGNYPNKEWALGVGKSLSLFAAVTILSDAKKLSSAIVDFFTKDNSDPLMTLTQSIVDVSKKIQEGVYTGNYPDKEWALGVGKSLSLFAAVTILSDAKKLSSAIVDFFTKDNSDPLMTLTQSIVNISLEIQRGKYGNNYPDKDWVTGITSVLESFMGVTKLADKNKLKTLVNSLFGGSKNPLEELSKSLVNVSKIIQDGVYSNNYPKIEWVNSISEIFESFIEVIKISEKNKLRSLIGNFFGGGKDPLEELARSMVSVSKMIKGGVYSSNYPTKEYVAGVSHYIISISDLIEKYDISTKEAKDFKETSSFVIPTINSWSLMLSKGEFKNVPNKSYSKDLVTFILSISEIVDDWDPNTTKSRNFTDSINIILPAIKKLTETPIITKDFSNSMKYVENGLDDVGDGISDFVKLELSIKDLEDFSKSMKYIVNAVKELENIPNINGSMVDNMKVIKDTLSVLSEGLDSILYVNSGGAKGFIKAFSGGKTKRSMDDFMNFSIALAHVAGALQILTTIKPMPSNVLNGFTKFLDDINKMPQLNEIDSTVSSINRLSDSFMLLANSLTQVNDNLKGFNDISKGLYLISIIDQTNFDNVLKSVDKHKGSLQLIGNIPEEQVNLLSVIKTLTDNIIESTQKEIGGVGVKDDKENVEKDKQQKQFYEDISQIRSLLTQFKDHVEKPSQAGSFNKYK